MNTIQYKIEIITSLLHTFLVLLLKYIIYYYFVEAVMKIMCYRFWECVICWRIIRITYVTELAIAILITAYMEIHNNQTKWRNKLIISYLFVNLFVISGVHINNLFFSSTTLKRVISYFWIKITYTWYPCIGSLKVGQRGTTCSIGTFYSSPCNTFLLFCSSWRRIDQNSSPVSMLIYKN